MPMKWSLVDSYGLDVVLRTLAKIRALHALQKLQHGSYGLSEASIRQAGQHTFGACHQFEPLKTSFFRARESACSWNCPDHRRPMPECSVFGYPPLSSNTAVFVISEGH